MKIIATLSILLAASSANAELYKCKINGKTTYQEKPCPGTGSEFKLRRDITPDQQKAAREKLKTELTQRAEQRLQENHTTSDGRNTVPAYSANQPQTQAPPAKSTATAQPPYLK